ncbi:hypothetical protein QBC46DRAFT_414177 [Diplogelasinospora grovesii]|uniref:Uncharacterized protein n=1 Tax=Diplogelasinospora grovesii TaxID=303347 RepID=A0AAN6RZF7_9PEZI|nr:hypothetical protein QBC46DRAFT_414177 [Diplogelasinospora grovesii]
MSDRNPKGLLALPKELHDKIFLPELEENDRICRMLAFTLVAKGGVLEPKWVKENQASLRKVDPNAWPERKLGTSTSQQSLEHQRKNSSTAFKRLLSQLGGDILPVLDRMVGESGQAPNGRTKRERLLGGLWSSAKPIYVLLDCREGKSRESVVEPSDLPAWGGLGPLNAQSRIWCWTRGDVQTVLHKTGGLFQELFPVEAPILEFNDGMHPILEFKFLFQSPPKSTDSAGSR